MRADPDERADLRECLWSDSSDLLESIDGTERAVRIAMEDDPFSVRVADAGEDGKLFPGCTVDINAARGHPRLLWVRAAG